MRPFFLKFLVGIILTGAVQCGLFQAKSDEALTLILFSSDVCGPCQNLAEEMQQNGIAEKWEFEENGCQYRVRIDRRHLADLENPPPEKMTEFLPEEILLAGKKSLGYDVYSDLASIQFWIVKTLQDAKIAPCG